MFDLTSSSCRLDDRSLGGSKRWTFSETMDIGRQSAVNRDFTVCIIRCVYRAGLILGR